VIPVVTPEEMAAIDAAAPEPFAVLVERAGAAVARRAVGLLGGTYGRRVAVIAGRGHNGDDGRVAARRLAAAGARVSVFEPGGALPRHGVDLVVDAAYGTGFVARGPLPDVATGGAPVLAVDIPSGVCGRTGTAVEGTLAATETVTFAALKPGLVLHPGRALAGRVVVADIGLPTTSARAFVVTEDDVAGWLPPRLVETHKWRSACLVVAGSPGMTGAAALCARAASRAGSGYVRVVLPDGAATAALPVEAVVAVRPFQNWADAALHDVDRFAAAVLGPGIGRGETVRAEVARFLDRCPVPTVVDGDALAVLGTDVAAVLRTRSAPTVLTPHDGEFAALTGTPPGADRLSAARMLAAATGAVVLLKGPTTVVAAPDGAVALSLRGDARLATAGTGDVLAGIVGALLGRGLEAARAAVVGAWLHGAAAEAGPAHGLVAADLVDLLPTVVPDRSAS
jgi:hydroxyethylthiazole kinase-like uncharacterized protein yjeF